MICLQVGAGDRAAAGGWGGHPRGGSRRQLLTLNPKTENRSPKPSSPFFKTVEFNPQTPNPKSGNSPLLAALQLRTPCRDGDDERSLEKVRALLQVLLVARF